MLACLCCASSARASGRANALPFGIASGRAVASRRTGTETEQGHLAGRGGSDAAVRNTLADMAASGIWQFWVHSAAGPGGVAINWF